MAKYDEQLDRMNFLMEFESAPKAVKTNIEYHANGADGKVYGILKEGSKYYIKTTESGKENIAESYEYINGFMNRKENEYKSYNEATKQLELKLMSLNEAFGKKSDVSTVDFKRGEKVLANLTEEARKELDRMNQIIENSCKIGRDCVCDPESKGSASPENTEKNNKPFEDKVTPDMDFSGSKGTVDGATDNKDVKGVEEDLQSDKMKSANSGSEKDFKDTHDDLDGEGVADKKPSGAKAVKMNEGMFEYDEMEAQPELDITDNDFEAGEEIDDPTLEPADDIHTLPGDDVVGVDDEDDVDMDALLQEFMDASEEEAAIEEGEDAITGPDKVMDKEGNPINGTNNGVDDEKGEDWKRIEEDEEYPAEEEGNEETLKSFKRKGTMDVQSCDRLNESQKNIVKKLTESIFQKLTAPKKKLTLEGLIDRIVKEEVTKLDVWGKHPKYQKEPMTTPANKEVMAGTADRDWNDDSAKGDQPYGKKIGNGKPFDQKVVDLLTDQVLAKIKGMNQ